MINAFYWYIYLNQLVLVSVRKEVFFERYKICTENYIYLLAVLKILVSRIGGNKISKFMLIALFPLACYERMKG